MTLHADLPGERLDAFLARTVPELTRSAAQKLIESGNVLRNGRPGRKNDKLNPGDEILSLYENLTQWDCILQFVRSGAIAITKNRRELLDEYLAEREKKFNENEGRC